MQLSYLNLIFSYAVVVALDYLDEDCGTVLQRLGEDLFKNKCKFK